MNSQKNKKDENILKYICIFDCVAACVRMLKVSLRTESGFKINQACVGLKAAVEEGCLLVPPTQCPYKASVQGGGLNRVTTLTKDELHKRCCVTQSDDYIQKG